MPLFRARRIVTRSGSFTVYALHSQPYHAIYAPRYSARFRRFFETQIHNLNADRSGCRREPAIPPSTMSHLPPPPAFIIVLLNVPTRVCACLVSCVTTFRVIRFSAYASFVPCPPPRSRSIVYHAPFTQRICSTCPKHNG